uniref:Aftiphilin clathrin-binding box domain-containing protein n=1 Tax=Anopheles farauti TaxID=69004 RepID=A0A182Q8S8_9DIPT
MDCSSITLLVFTDTNDVDLLISTTTTTTTTNTTNTSKILSSASAVTATSTNTTETPLLIGSRLDEFVSNDASGSYGVDLQLIGFDADDAVQSINASGRPQTFDDYLDLSVQEMLQKATTGQPEDGPKSEVLDSQVAENASPIAADDIAVVVPSRGVTPISRDITDRDIVVREYHDVEYRLEKSCASSIPAKKEADFEDFNDFQFVPAAAPTALPTSPVMAAISASRPVIGRSPTEELEKTIPEPSGVKLDISSTAAESSIDIPDEDEFSDFQAAIPSTIPVVPPINRTVTNVQNNRSTTSSPVMLLSPAILLPQQTNTAMEKDTANMRKTASAGSINWPDPGIDPDELARFEAAFAKPVPTTTVVPSFTGTPSVATSQQPTASATNKAPATEEDEWTDFISSKPVATNDANTVQPLVTSAATGAQEEWTDFISSSATVSAGDFTSYNRLSSSQNSFNYPRAASKASQSSTFSWAANQTPQLPPPQFSSWNSNSLYYNPMSSLPLANQQQSSQYLPHQQQQQQQQQLQSFYNRHSDIPAMAFAGGAGYSGTPKVPTIPTHHHAPLGPQQLPPPPVQLLPELSFITPNVTGHSAGTPGAKSTTHSFLSNVISSNNFTKK